MASDPFRDENDLGLDEVSGQLHEIDSLADDVGRALSRAFRSAASDGKSLQSILKDIAMSFEAIALRAALKPVAGLISDAVSGLFSAAAGATRPVPAFAKGGVIASPTYFPFAGGFGLAGEAGPEAILPLSRGPDGRLGVAAAGGAINVTFNVAATDARSFLASEAELSAMLLRAVRRGTRAS